MLGHVAAEPHAGERSQAGAEEYSIEYTVRSDRPEQPKGGTSPNGAFHGGPQTFSSQVQHAPTNFSTPIGAAPDHLTRAAAVFRSLASHLRRSCCRPVCRILCAIDASGSIKSYLLVPPADAYYRCALHGPGDARCISIFVFATSKFTQSRLARNRVRAASTSHDARRRCRDPRVAPGTDF